MAEQLTAALGDGDRAQLKAWFASQRARSVPVTPLRFPLRCVEVFGAPAKEKGGALGVDFVVARQAFAVVDVGKLPAIEGRAGRATSTLRLAQRMSEGGIGAVVWHCGRAMCHALPRLPELMDEGRFARGTRVLELGCGTGLVGIACWLRGADAALTDFGAICELATENALANVGVDGAIPPGLLVAPHEWGAGLSAELRAPYDVIIGSDCLYDAAALPALLKTLLAASSERTVIYLAYKRRVDERERPFFAELEECFAEVRFSEVDETPEEWRGTGLHLCRITGKKDHSSPDMKTPA